MANNALQRLNVVIKNRVNTLCCLHRIWYSDVCNVDFKTLFEKSDAVLKIDTTKKEKVGDYIITAELLKNVNNEHLLGIESPSDVDMVEVSFLNNFGMVAIDMNFEDYQYKLAPFFRHYCFFPHSNDKNKISLEHLPYYVRATFTENSSLDNYIFIIDVEPLKNTQFWKGGYIKDIIDSLPCK